MKTTADIRTFETPDELFEQTAAWLLEISRLQSRFTMALSGGSTPAGLYRVMASKKYRDLFPWHRMRFFFSDERYVPAQDERSNFRLARELLFEPAGVPLSRVYPVPTGSKSPQKDAALYEKQVRKVSFDVILLGLGTDGHTASLFPGDPAVKEAEKLVTAACLKSKEPRITFTLPLIHSAKHVVFLVSGKDKEEKVREILGGNPAAKNPASLVKPASGRLHWFLKTS